MRFLRLIIPIYNISELAVKMNEIITVTTNLRWVLYRKNGHMVVKNTTSSIDKQQIPDKIPNNKLLEKISFINVFFVFICPP
jgi:hypothetical protein